MTNQTLRITAVAASLVLIVAGFASAQLDEFGALGAEDGADEEISGLMLVTLGSAEIKFYDQEDTGGYDCAGGDCDPIYLSIDGGSKVQIRDIRLSDSDGGNGGTQVEDTDDDDFDNPLDDDSATNFDPGWGFIDDLPESGADGEFNLGEYLYLDADGSGDISIGDVRIIEGSGEDGEPGSSDYEIIETSSDDDNMGTSLSSLTGFQYAVIDLDINGAMSLDDGLILDVNANERFDPPDVALYDFDGGPGAGEVPELGDDLTFHGFLDDSDDAAFTPQWAWADTGDDTVGSDETIYLDVDGDDEVSIGDVAIGPGSDASVNEGEVIESGADEIGTDLESSFPANGGVLRFFDANGNNAYDAEDDLYLDVGGLTDDEVESRDLAVACGDNSDDCSNPGERVETGDDAIGAALKAFGTQPSFAFLDQDGGGTYNHVDPIFLDADDDSVATGGDIPLSEPDVVSLATFGEPLTDDDDEVEFCFRFTFASAKVGFIDEDNSGAYNPGEPLYLDRAGDDDVDAQDVRLIETDEHSAGTFVRGSDSDQGDGLTSFASDLPFVFRDANGDASYTLENDDDDDDEIYLDLDASDKVSVGDARISSTDADSAGTTVTSGDDDLNRPLGSLPAGFAVRGVDLDGDGLFGQDDALILNIDEAAEDTASVPNCFTPGDLILSGSGVSSSRGGSSGGSGGSGGSSGPTVVSPNIRFSQPTDDQYFQTGDLVVVKGTASAGTTSTGTSTSISSVTMTINGDDVSVSGTSSWSTSFTARPAGDFVLEATVTAADGDTDTATITVHANADGEAPMTTCPDGSEVAAGEDCPDDGGDDGGEPSEDAQEALDRSERAEERAKEARDSAREAENNSREALDTINEINDRLGNDSGTNGSPGPGVLAALVAIGGALLIRRRIDDA